MTADPYGGGGGGGYSRTAYNAAGGDDAGGFVYGGTQAGGGGGGGGGGGVGGSQSGASKGYGDESLRPVTIKQIIEAEQAFPDAPFRIDGVEVTQVTFVGQVRTFSEQTTNITFRVDDGTGLVEVKQWLDADRPDGGKSAFGHDQYVRVWGRLKSFHNKRHVGAHVIKPVLDFHEVAYHLLEATYVHLSLTKGISAAAGGGVSAHAAKAGGDDSLFVDGGALNQDHKLRKLPKKAQDVYSWLVSSSNGTDGTHLGIIAQSTGLSFADAASAAEVLLHAGLIYTTLDDQTFAILDY